MWNLNKYFALYLFLTGHNLMKTIIAIFSTFCFLFAHADELQGDIENPIIILKAAAYNEEIRNDILENINSNTNFWE